jgi:hypothetical protein
MHTGALRVLAHTLLIMVAGTSVEAQDSVADYGALMREIDGLAVYNELLEAQIREQQAELENLRSAVEEAPQLERQIPALLIRMIEGLEQFVALDLPFLPDERNARVADLKVVLARPEVTTADKLRRVLEAFQIENEYGRSIEAYVGRLDIDGTVREGEYLRVGRIALLFQTPDLEYTGAWDRGAGQWQELGGQHRNAVRQGIRMARAQTAPDLIMLPVPAPQP